MAQPIGVILQELADFGLFFYILPFLLLFALVYGILYKINFMGGDAKNNKPVYAIISVAVALLALQFDSVPLFFQIIFPKLGIGLSILLMFLIMSGLFLDFDKDKKTGGKIILFTAAAVLAVIILLTSFDDYSWWTGSFWQQNISAIVAGIIILVFVAIVVSSGATDPTRAPFPLREWSK